MHKFPLFITFARLVFAVLVLPPLFFMAPWQGQLVWAWALCGLFLLVCTTDFLDGRVARLLGCETDAGQVMDPVADKILASSMFFILVATGRLDVLAALVFIGREFLVMGVRELALMRGFSVRVARWGKYKTFVQMILIAYEIVNPVYYGYTSSIYPLFEQLLIWLALALSIGSAAGYVRSFLRQSGCAR